MLRVDLDKLDGSILVHSENMYENSGKLDGRELDGPREKNWGCREIFRSLWYVLEAG